MIYTSGLMLLDCLRPWVKVNVLKLNVDSPIVQCGTPYVVECQQDNLVFAEFT